MPKLPKDKKYCGGCDSDFYNGNNPMGIKECWSYKMAKVVKRFCIGWWIPMDREENFSEIQTLNCHTESGKRAFLEKLPSHLT